MPGGTILFEGSGGEGFCLNASCTQAVVGPELREFISGSITAVPIPTAVWLFGSAMAGLGWMRRKQVAR
jgi:hypothetical protein